MMHCSNRNSKKEKKTLRSLKFNPSVDSPHICTRKLDLLSKGDRLQNRKIYSAHVYRPPHMWCRRTDTQCSTVPLYRQCINLAEYTVLSFSGSSLVLVVAALWLGRTFIFQRCKCSVLRRWRLPKHADIRLVGVQELASPRRDDHGHA